MARFYDDFSNVPFGTAPAGLSVVFGTLGSGGGAAVTAEGVLRTTLVSGFGGGRADLVFSAGPAGLVGETVEMAMRFRTSNNTPKRPLIVRYAGGNAFVLYVRGDASPSYSVARASDGLGGSSPVATSFAPNTWYRARLRAEGGSGSSHVIRGRMWPDGSPEPSGWGSESVFAENLGGTSKSGVFGFSVAQATSGTITFDVDWVGFATGGASAPSEPLDVYRGYRVLGVEPNGAGESVVAATLRTALLDAGTGASRHRRAGRPRVSRGFNWFMGSRGDVAAFRAWVAERKGRQVPFWVPTWHHDLRLAASSPVGAAQIDVLACAYPALLVGDAARSHLAIMAPSGEIMACGVVAATALGTVDRLSLSTSLDFAVDPSRHVLGYLVLCRLENDAADIHWRSSTVAECAFRFTELPEETPTP